MVSTTDEVSAPVELQQPADIKAVNEEDFEKAQKLFQLGKKNLFMNKFDESVNNIGEACKTYASKFGEMDPQCAEVYYFYGRALLELARVENTVLGNALTDMPEEEEPINDSRFGNPEDVAADEKNDIAEKVIDALCSIDATATSATTSTEPAAVEMTPVETTTTTTTTETPVVATDAAVAEAKPETAEEEEEDEEDDEEGEDVEDEPTAEEKAAEEAKEDADDDVTNLQSAWEMFELAKVIYTKQTDSTDSTATEAALFKSKRIAECLLKLGEISIEQETYEQAITDIGESIRVQETLAAADRDERMLAESYYQMGMARQFNNQFGDANEAYQRSINIVQLRVEKLRARLAAIEGDSADATLERTTISDEIAELEVLLPDMQGKLEEVNEQGQQTMNFIREAAKECFTATGADAVATGGATCSSAAAKDITSMLKRKMDDDVTCAATKKTRTGEEEMAPLAVEESSAVGAIEVDENKENAAAATVVAMDDETAVKETAVVAEPAVAAVEIA